MSFSHKTALFCTLSLITIALVLATPVKTRAFWFFNFVKAAGGNGEPPIVHDSSMQLLAAAINSDPNPEKGGGELVVTEGSALVPTAGPEGSIMDISTTDGGTGEISTYVVKEGDSISSIAAENHVSVNTIRWANNLTRTSTIAPGQTLVILPVTGVQHTVQKGETLASIAKKFNSDAGDIASFNGLNSNESLRAGEALIIPGGEIIAAASATTKKTTSKPSSKSSSGIKQGGGLTSLGRAGGAELDGFYGNPVPGALLTQSIHGWNGVDLGAPAGTPVYAAAGGVVIVSRVGGWNGGYGNYVVIRHSNGTQTLYSHLLRDNVSVGETVSRGQVIGSVGKTGEATGNHLHFEVRGARNPFAGCSAGTHCSPR